MCPLNWVRTRIVRLEVNKHGSSSEDGRLWNPSRELCRRSVGNPESQDMGEELTGEARRGSLERLREPSTTVGQNLRNRSPPKCTRGAGEGL